MGPTVPTISLSPNATYAHKGRSLPLLKKFQELLHQYKLEVFHNEHNKLSDEEITSQCMHVTEEILEEKFHYHFHKLPDANRAEIINMINNYTREAVLPPVVEKLVHRQVLLEKRIEAIVHLMEHLLEALSARAEERETA